jgi:hypothetical protein
MSYNGREYNYDDFTILPSNYRGHLSYEKATVIISVETNEADYRCREIDESTETKEVVDEDGYPCYQELSNRDLWDEMIRLNGSHREMSSLIPKSVGESIANLFFTRCSDGKYTNTFIYLDEKYYEEVEYEQSNTDGGGHLYAEYVVLIYLQ